MLYFTFLRPGIIFVPLDPQEKIVATFYSSINIGNGAVKLEHSRGHGRISRYTMKFSCDPPAEAEVSTMMIMRLQKMDVLSVAINESMYQLITLGTFCQIYAEVAGNIILLVNHRSAMLCQIDYAAKTAVNSTRNEAILVGSACLRLKTC